MRSRNAENPNWSGSMKKLGRSTGDFAGSTMKATTATMLPKDLGIRQGHHLIVRRLLDIYARGGCIRVPNLKLRASKDKLKRQRYKKGYEIRFVTASADELAQTQRLLKDLGLRVASPYVKGKQIIQPAYGREVVQWWQSLLESNMAKQ
jgi:hypothetical protein